MFLLLLPLQIFAHTNPWLIQEYEKKIDGTVLSIDKHQIRIKKDQKEYLFVLDNNILSALMGKFRGKLVTPTDYPTGVEVELYFNKENRVRAMRNKQISFINNEGKLLDAWGHDVSLSPDENYLCIYNFETGLFLYPTSSAYNNSTRVYLSPLSVSAWNNKGELAVTLDNSVLIFYPTSGTRTIINLPLQINTDYCRIITSLEWNNNNDKILYTALEDYPDTESTIFKLAVLDRDGKHLGTTFISNLGSSIWLSSDLILYLTYENIEENQGKMMLWNYKTGKTSEFLPNDQYYCKFAYNPKLEQLAFAQEKGLGETLFILNMNTGITHELITLPYTIRNLQWSSFGTLFFWDEYNNCVSQLVNLPIQDVNTPSTTTNKECSVVPIATGYLPANSVRNSMIFFLAEPLEEPMQAIIQKPD
jgi:hypothetical protein